MEDLHTILRRRWEAREGKRRSKWSIPWVTAVSVFLEVAVFAYHNSLGMDFEEILSTSILPFDSNNRTEAWRLVTNIFVHSDTLHLLSNVIVQVIFMAAVEAAWGSRMTLLFFLVGGIAGCLLFSVLNMCFILGGASGGISSILAVVIISCYRARHSRLRNIIAVILLLYLTADNILAWCLDQGIAVFGHVGGFLTGALLYTIFEIPDRLWFGYSRRMILAAGFILLMIKAVDYNITLNIICVGPKDGGIFNGTRMEEPGEFLNKTQTNTTFKDIHDDKLLPNTF